MKRASKNRIRKGELLFGELHDRATFLKLEPQRQHNVWKILPALEGVQLIVFFCAIREILKREIYKANKQFFSPLENEPQKRRAAKVRTWKFESGRFDLQIVIGTLSNVLRSNAPPNATRKRRHTD